MNSGDLHQSEQPVGQFDLVSVLKTLFYSILVPNGLIVGVVGLTYVLSTFDVRIFDRFAAGVGAGFLLMWAALLIGGLSGSAIVGWITAKRYGNRAPLLLIIPCGLLMFPLYFFRPWEGIPPLGIVVVALIVPLVIGAVGTLTGVFAKSMME